jgi:ribosome assembly protein RRB1
MDWSSLRPGRLLTGDCDRHIYFTERHDDGSWVTHAKSFKGHQASVEDLQWSPTQDGVFASCSVDQTVKIWDIKNPSKYGLEIQAHTTDVNVISWNRRVPYLLASGADDGTFSVWDLRHTSAPAATFQWHKGPITSIEWNPHDESVLAATGADDQLTIWDFSVEHDPEEDAALDAEMQDVPPQLLFIHQGQTDMKELHWHRQMPGVVVSTAMSGFNIFKTINV